MIRVTAALSAYQDLGPLRTKRSMSVDQTLSLPVPMNERGLFHLAGHHFVRQTVSITYRGKEDPH